LIRRLFYILLPVWLICVPEPAFSQDADITVTAGVDRQTAYIGDLINYTIDINYDSTIVLTPPAVGINLGGFEVKDYNVGEEKRQENGRFSQNLSFKLATYTTGEFIIPSMPLEYMTPDSVFKTIAADPIKIEIKSILADTVGADTLLPRNMKPQASLPHDNTVTYIVIAAVIVVLAIVAVIYIIRRRRQHPEDYFDPRSPFEIAMDDLKQLHDEHLPYPGDLKIYYLELTDILRRYLGRHFEFNAIDLTTEEIAEILEEWRLDKDFLERMIVFLRHADLIKFAKLVPPEDQPEKDWQTAYDLVNDSQSIMAFKLQEKPVGEVVMKSYDVDENVDPDLKYAPVELHDKILAEKRSEEENL